MGLWNNQGFIRGCFQSKKEKTKYSALFFITHFYFDSITNGRAPRRSIGINEINWNHDVLKWPNNQQKHNGQKISLISQTRTSCEWCLLSIPVHALSLRSATTMLLILNELLFHRWTNPQNESQTYGKTIVQNDFVSNLFSASVYLWRIDDFNRLQLPL